MKKNYLKPEAEVINLTAEEQLTWAAYGDAPIEEGDQSVIEKPGHWE